MPKKYFEYRGVSHAVYAEVLSDDSTGIVFGTVKDLTGVSEIGRSTESSNDTHFYDNIPAIVIESDGADEVSINTSGIPFDVLAEITGQYYDSTNGMMVEQERVQKYFAFGYVTDKTDGTKVLVWRQKGVFSVPDLTSATKDDGTDANGQELTYTGVTTAYKYNATGKGAKAINIDTSVNTEMSESAFFTSVQTPDTIASAAETTYTLAFSVDAGTAIATQTYNANVSVVLPIPEYTGHTFLGWYDNAEFTGSAITSVTMTANKTVYAKWSA